MPCRQTWVCSGLFANGLVQSDNCNFFKLAWPLRVNKQSIAVRYLTIPSWPVCWPVASEPADPRAREAIDRCSAPPTHPKQIPEFQISNKKRPTIDTCPPHACILPACKLQTLVPPTHPKQIPEFQISTKKDRRSIRAHHLPACLQTANTSTDHPTIHHLFCCLFFLSGVSNGPAARRSRFLLLLLGPGPASARALFFWQASMYALSTAIRMPMPPVHVPD